MTFSVSKEMLRGAGLPKSSVILYSYLRHINPANEDGTVIVRTYHKDLVDTLGWSKCKFARAMDALSAAGLVSQRRVYEGKGQFVFNITVRPWTPSDDTAAPIENNPYLFLDDAQFGILSDIAMILLAHAQETVRLSGQYDEVAGLWYAMMDDDALKKEGIYSSNETLLRALAELESTGYVLCNRKTALGRKVYLCHDLPLVEDLDAKAEPPLPAAEPHDVILSQEQAMFVASLLQPYSDCIKRKQKHLRERSGPLGAEAGNLYNQSQEELINVNTEVEQLDEVLRALSP